MQTMKRIAMLVSCATLLMAGCTQQAPVTIDTVVADAEKAVTSTDHAISELETVESETVSLEVTESDKLNARNVLSQALATGKAENKAVFIHFTADW